MTQRSEKRIRKLRLEQGLSQRAISQPGISYAYVSRVEAGARRLSLIALIELATKLDTTRLYLLPGRHDAHRPLCGRHRAGLRICSVHSSHHAHQIMSYRPGA